MRMGTWRQPTRSLPPEVERLVWVSPTLLALSTVRWQKMFRMRVNNATIGQWSAKYIAGMRAARSLEWRCLWSCMGTMAWCAADFCATQPRQLGAARSDFGPGTARRPPDRQEMQRHRARAHCDHRRPCWQRSGRSCRRPPSPCPWARPQPPARHSQACRARLAVRFALPSPQRTPAPSPSFSCAWAQPLLAAGGAGAQRGWPQASKRMCGSGASASACLKSA